LSGWVKLHVAAIHARLWLTEAWGMIIVRHAAFLIVLVSAMESSRVN